MYFTVQAWVRLKTRSPSDDSCSLIIALRDNNANIILNLCGRSLKLNPKYAPIAIPDGNYLFTWIWYAITFDYSLQLTTFILSTPGA